MSNIRVNLRPLLKVVDKLAGRPSDNLANQIGKVYSAYVKRRFVKLSRGGSDAVGGGWKPLKKSTIARRRKGKAKGKATILRDTGKLFEGLDVGSPGNLFKKIKGGVKFGYGGSARHIGGRITIAKIARIHHKGLGNVPVRKIIVAPDKSTTNQLAKLFKMEVERLGVKSGGRYR